MIESNWMTLTAANIPRQKQQENNIDATKIADCVISSSLAMSLKKTGNTFPTQNFHRLRNSSTFFTLC